MKVLVTGGGGFLGASISRQLLARGATVLCLQRSAAPDMEKRGALVIQDDLSTPSAMHDAVRGCDAVIHTAGKAGAWGPYDDYFRINVTGTENVIAACLEHGVRYLVYTSSPSVAHGGGDIEGGDESLPYPAEFASPYPATKAIAERRVMAANGPELQTVSLRPHLIWGPGDPHLLPRLLQRSRRGSLALPGGDKLIDTVYVDNAAEAHLLALDALLAGRDVGGKTYFISNDEPLPQKEIIRALLDAAGVNVPIRSISPTMAGMAGSVVESAWKLLGIRSEPPITRWAAEQLSTAHWYDISAAKRDLAFRPRVSIEKGLERLRKHLTGQVQGP